MKYIKINGKDFPHPLDFEMSTQPNITSQLTTMSGRNIADVNGWTYADMTLKWQWLESKDLNELIRETDPMQGSFTFTFDDITTGQPNTVNAIRTSFGGQRLPVVDKGKTVWVDIEMSISFPDCYQ
jgi:hypothetical protein